MPSLSNSDESVNIKINTESDGKGIDETKDGLNSLSSDAQDVDKKMGNFSENFQSSMHKVAAVTGVAGAALTIYAKSSVDKLGQLVSSSKTLGTQTGMTTEKSSELVAAMGRLGIQSDAATASFRILSKNIVENRTAADVSTTSLGKLGVATKDAAGVNKSFDAILYDVADKFKSMPDGAEKTATALDLFGRSGAGMIKILNQGSEGIQKLEADAKALGLTLTTENISTMSAYIKSQKELAASSDSIRLAVGALTAPVLTEFNVQLNNVTQSLIGQAGPLRDITVGFLAFGGPVLAGVAGVAEFAANIAGAIPLMQGLAGLIGTPIIMPAIAVGAALAALGLVIAKTYETIDVITQAADAIDKTKKSSDQTDAAMKKAHEEGRISTEQLQTYIRNTEAQANKTKENMYTGFFGPLNRSLDALFVQITGTKDKFAGSGFGEETKKKSSGGGGGFATGGFTGQGGPNEVAGVVHKGEYVLPQSMVDQSSGLPKLMAGGNSMTVTIQNLHLDAGGTQALFQVQDRDAMMRSLNLSPSRGQ